MESKKHITSARFPEPQERAEGTARASEGMSVAQIEGLVQLLDGSDVSELEVTSTRDDVHLVLRKLHAPDGSTMTAEAVSEVASNGAAAETLVPPSAANQHTITAHLVGVFHPWLKPRGGTLAALGDRIKAGQLVGTIESLNVLNDVESAKAGRVVAIHVSDGQPVEYGQALLTIEEADDEGKA